MTNEEINENFNKCIAWIRENSNKIGRKPLCIGWGEADYSHPWEEDFENRSFSLKINDNFGLPLRIETFGCRYIHTYGYTKEAIEKSAEMFKRNGMAYPDCDHTFEDFGVAGKEQFLLEWKTIKGRITDRINEVASLENFEV